MKAEDLMIGDWIGWLPTWKNDETGEIEWDGDRNDTIIGKVGMLMKDCTTIDYCDESIEVEDIGLISIPLTPEILEKNGFEKRKKYFLVPNDPSLALLKEGINGGHGYSFLIGHFWEVTEDFRWFIEIQFVHELQHALRLCGIEKEIEL